MEAAPSMLNRISRPLLVGGLVVSGVLAATQHPAAAASTSVPLSSITVTPSSVVGGNISTGTVNLAAPAPADGALVMLSDNSAAASAPTSVTVPGGSTSFSFSIPTVPVSTGTTATIFARTDAGSVSTSLNVRAPAVLSITIDQAHMIGGVNSAAATVTLDGDAPAAGTIVTLWDESPAAIPPASVKVDAGQRSKSFSIGTAPVSVLTRATVYASAGNVTRTSVVTVRPARPKSLSMNPSSVAGGTTSRGTVSLEGPAGPAGNLVTLTGGSPAASTQPSVTVAANESSASFDVNTTPVTSETTVVITGTGYGSYSAQGRLTVRPPGLSSVSIDPWAVDGGDSATGTVTLEGKAASPITVSISDNSGRAWAPSSVTVPAGASSAQFPISTITSPTSGQATFSATAMGLTRTAVLTIWAPEPMCGDVYC